MWRAKARLGAGTVADSLYGGTAGGSWGDQVMYGELGHDVLSGGKGSDQLYGGQQDDTLDGGAQIYLTDFTRGEDRIDLNVMGVGFGDVIKSGNWLQVGILWISTGLAAQVTASDFVF